ncbi:MAG: hypothetical protein WCQ70_02510 [Lentimicrobiaceae bacterium]
MIYIITEEGCLLDLNDSTRYVTWKIKDSFYNLSAFKSCSEINDPLYWGENILLGTKENYFNWTNQIAESVLKK